MKFADAPGADLGIIDKIHERTPPGWPQLSRRRLRPAEKSSAEIAGTMIRSISRQP
jgi:hypothetical protein